MQKNGFAWAVMTKAMSLVMVVVVLTSCGAETAGTAATSAEIKAKEVERAQQQLEAAKKELEEAQRVMQQRVEDAERSASGATVEP